MHRFVRDAVIHVGALTLASSLFALPAGAGTELVSLAHLAPELGFTYTWIASESAVALTRPGVYVLVRTGNPLYDVNTAVESAAQTPQYRNNDIYVGSGLVERLRTLAARPVPGEAPVAAPTVSHAAPIGGALTVGAIPTNVADSVVVSGTGPANAPLTITLRADISRDIPRVLLSRTKLVTDAAGKYSVEIPTAPLHLQNSVVLVSATSAPGVAEAHTSFVLGGPNPKMAQPVDDLPRDFRPHR
jgi:multisubunit Na+/H+ antiporter MnhB subunit